VPTKDGRDPFNRSTHLYVFFEGDRWVGDWPDDDDPAEKWLTQRRLDEARERGWRWERHDRKTARKLGRAAEAAHEKALAALPKKERRKAPWFRGFYAAYQPRSGRRPWTEEDDRFLLAYGWCVGISRIANDDLDRDPENARRRVKWLAKHKPDLFAELWKGEEDLDTLIRMDGDLQAEREEEARNWTPPEPKKPRKPRPRRQPAPDAPPPGGASSPPAAAPPSSEAGPGRPADPTAGAR
jgi:hypothetical protein